MKYSYTGHLSSNLVDWDLALLRSKDFPLAERIKKIDDGDMIIFLTALTYEVCIDLQKYLKETEETFFEGYSEAREEFDLQE